MPDNFRQRAMKAGDRWANQVAEYATRKWYEITQDHAAGAIWGRNDALKLTPEKLWAAHDAFEIEMSDNGGDIIAGIRAALLAIGFKKDEI